jgi:very-short-patch-repair endonuclease
MTVAERRVWQILRLHQMKGYKFRRQVPIGRYIADFVCHGARLIVEIDGGQHDRSSSEEGSRTHFLKGQGYRVLRFWNNEVLENPAASTKRSSTSWAGSPPPHPPPQGRGLLRGISGP